MITSPPRWPDRESARTWQNGSGVLNPDKTGRTSGFRAASAPPSRPMRPDADCSKCPSFLQEIFMPTMRQVVCAVQMKIKCLLFGAESLTEKTDVQPITGEPDKCLQGAVGLLGSGSLHPGFWVKPAWILQLKSCYLQTAQSIHNKLSHLNVKLEMFYKKKKTWHNSLTPEPENINIT